MTHRGRWAGAFAAAIIAAYFCAPLLGACAPVTTEAQAPATADAAFWLKAFGTHQTMTAASPYKALVWQSIGPTNNAGRMTSIAVGDKNGSRVIYVGAASGGVWKSLDRGDTWQPVFEHEATASVGDVAVAPSNPDIVWVGTGEDNLFRAGLAGTGIYKSTDAGKTWTHMGLTDSGTIGRIIVHPTNPDIVYVAASGHEWTANEMRGVFMTTDGGKNWTKAFYRSPTTGAVDLVMDPSDPNTLYVGMWQRARRKWSDPRVEPGYSEGGIWKTTDGGKTWKAANDGLTPAEFRGRVGVDVSRSNPNTIFAVIDSYEQGRAAQPGERDAYGRPLPSGSHIIKGLVVFRSDDKGASWKQVSGQTPETSVAMMGLGGTYSWVFTQIRVDPKDVNTVYVQALATNVSHDGGATFTRYAGTGGDNHRLWIDPDQPLTTYIAHDGGFMMTDDGGQTRKQARGINGTQFYNVEVDNATPFHIYGSVQDTGSHRVALDMSHGWNAVAPLNWDGAPGGEGSNQAIDFTNPNIVYSHGYYGNFSRTDLTPQPPPPPAPDRAGGGGAGGAAPQGAPGRGRGRGGASTNIRPPDPDLRAQWMAPIIVSQFDHQTIYAGYQSLFRSHDMGATWEKISADLTSNDPTQMGINPSAIPYQTITQIAESPKRQGLLFVGTDDGHLWTTRDDGKTWAELTANIPMTARKWISRIVPSRTDEATVYVAERGREDDDFAPYLWKSTDSGKSWKSIVGNIPAGSVNVIREDPAVPNLLYVGNDFGVYVSTDGGAKWNVLGSNLPTNEVSDIQIQARDNVIVAATYGRGMFVMDATKVRAIK
jgi:photosystem II stability/assembly factor-like uncharacterized protein